MNEYSNDNKVLESKLQGVAASFLRERDEAVRTKQLAIEKMKLQKEETEAAQLTLQNLKEKFNYLQSSLSVGDEVRQLLTEVDTLKKQVSFQHHELVNMKAKQQGHQSKFASDQAKLDAELKKLRATVQARRDYFSSKDIDRFSIHSSDECQAKWMKKELEENLDVESTRWRSQKWAILVNKAIATAEQETQEMIHELQTVQSTLDYYHRKFPDIP